MKPKMLILSVVGLILTVTLVAANMLACEDARQAETVDTPSQTAESSETPSQTVESASEETVSYTHLTLPTN